MKKLSKIEEAIHIKENDLFGDEDMKEINKIKTYCQELLGTDLVAPETPEGKKLNKALSAFINGASGLLAVLTELDNNEILPYDTGGALPEPEEIIELLK